MTFEEKLAQAFKETLDERTENLMRVEKKHRFSLAYRIWERKILRDLRRNRVDKRWSLKRARYAAAAMITAFALLIGGTAYGAVALSRRFMPRDTDYYIAMLIEKSPEDKSSFEEFYGLSEEDGWELKDFQIHDGVVAKSKFTRGDKAVIFTQMLFYADEIHIDKGKADIEMYSFYSEDDGFVQNYKYKNYTKIYWLCDGYILTIYSDMNKDDLIKLAYSTKIIDPPENF